MSQKITTSQIEFCGVSSNKYIYKYNFSPKAQGTLSMRGQKNFKSLRFRMLAVKLCLIVTSEATL